MGVLRLVPSGSDMLHRFFRAVIDSLGIGTGSIFVTHNDAVLIAIPSQA
jgi:hypothetical protein